MVHNFISVFTEDERGRVTSTVESDTKGQPRTEHAGKHTLQNSQEVQWSMMRSLRKKQRMLLPKCHMPGSTAGSGARAGPAHGQRLGSLHHLEVLNVLKHRVAWMVLFAHSVLEKNREVENNDIFSK